MAALPQRQRPVRPQPTPSMPPRNPGAPWSRLPPAKSLEESLPEDFTPPWMKEPTQSDLQDPYSMAPIPVDVPGQYYWGRNLSVKLLLLS